MGNGWDGGKLSHPRIPTRGHGDIASVQRAAVGGLGEASVLRLSCHVALHGLPPWPGVSSPFLLRSLLARLPEQLTFDLLCEILHAKITQLFPLYLAVLYSFFHYIQHL